MIESAALLRSREASDAVRGYPQRVLPNVGVLRSGEYTHVNGDSRKNEVANLELFEEKLKWRPIEGGVPRFENRIVGKRAG